MPTSLGEHHRFGIAVVGGVLVALASIVSIAALKGFAIPYVWIALVWASVMLCGWVLVPRAKTAWISLTVLLSVLAALEGFFWASEHWVFKDIRSEGTFTWASDPLLGYTAPKGVALTEAKFYRGKKLYDVVYTMDANGLRIASPNVQSYGAATPCILFFGDAYTYGWGLNDQDTLPYRVAVKLKEKYRVYNMSFLTHGPQQMLAILEHNLVSKETRCTPGDVKYVIYSATPDQVRKAAGLREIDHLHGPRYVLAADGSVKYRGQFGEDPSRVEKLRAQLEKSFLYRSLVGGNAIYYRRYNDADVALYLAIVKAARARVKTLYPDAQFHVFVWGNDAVHLDKSGSLSKKLIGGLEAMEDDLKVHRVNDILPGSDTDDPAYFLGRFSLHPNAAANDRLAEYVANMIVKH